VVCTASTDQPSDQGALCATSCTGDADCDPGAHCAGSICVTDGNAGDPCAETRECGSGLSCVDGVCCTSTCAGTCRACDVPGSLGTCTLVGANTDPDGECAGFSCSDYYWGWSGDGCYLRAAAPDAAVSCDGAGACRLPSAVCPTMGQGSLTVTCEALCQDPNAGTCTGTTAGICTNVTPTPSTQTCGTGYCQVTTDRCLAGAPQTCIPLAPRAETCNNIDDDCNGTVDDNVSGAVDGYEPNNTCGLAYYLGTVAEENSEASWSATIYASGDVDYYRFYAREQSGLCVPFTDEDFRVQVRLVPPQSPDCRDYDLYLYNDSCSQLAYSIAGSCLADVITYTWDGACASDDSEWFRVRVVPLSGAWECAHYTLYVDMWQL